MNATKFRRGFKSLAEELALELRRELRLSPADRLDARALAAHLAIPVLSLPDLLRAGASLESVLHFQNVAPEAFSAMTIVDGSRQLIVVNDAHAPVRQSSNIVHELSHVILEHELHNAVGAHGCRVWNDVMEQEADWLGGVLLVPRGGALFAARKNWALEVAARHFAVSEQMMRWRLAHTGASIQAQRERAKSFGSRRRRVTRLG